MSLLVNYAYAQQLTKNVVLITIDGLRWQELFAGADADILTNKRYVENIARRYR